LQTTGKGEGYGNFEYCQHNNGEKYLGLPTPEGIRINLKQQRKGSSKGLVVGQRSICLAVQKKF
jgi:hypothetical protein